MPKSKQCRLALILVLSCIGCGGPGSAPPVTPASVSLAADGQPRLDATLCLWSDIRS